MPYPTFFWMIGVGMGEGGPEYMCLYRPATIPPTPSYLSCQVGVVGAQVVHRMLRLFQRAGSGRVPPDRT